MIFFRSVGQIGSMGLARPRRLSPLSPVDTPLQVNNKEEGGIWKYSDVMPTPAGLHLSVNYTQNLGLGECLYVVYS